MIKQGGTYAEMQALTNPVTGVEFVVNSGANQGTYEYKGGTLDWVQTHDATGAALVSPNNSSSWIWPNLLYPNGPASGLTQTINALVYESANVTPYGCHKIHNTSATDPVAVYVSLNGTDYATLPAAVTLHDDVTTGGGLMVVSIPAGKVGILKGVYNKIKVLKAAGTVETPSIRYAHSVN